MGFPKFSVAMCVYGGDHPQWFQTAVESVRNQTVPPNEIVLVVDGPVPQELEDVICPLEEDPLFQVVRLAENQGLGPALNEAIRCAKYELIARMDSDDISVPDRFERQLAFFEAHTDVDIVGGYITEFVGEERNVVGCRTVPGFDGEIKDYLKTRCPLNHVTVLFRKEAVMGAGNYLEWYSNEDYYLWVRMYRNGAKFANIEDTLVFVRVGEEMYQRRGGVRYFKSEAKLQSYMLKHHVIGPVTYAANIAKRLIVQVLLPNKLRGWVFQKFARS